MNAALLIATSLKSLNHHKGRSFLTMLGIIIGIASIIAILAIGNGAAEKTRRQILAQGQNYIFVHAGNWQTEGKVKSKKQKKEKRFTADDLDSLLRLIPSVAKVSPFVQAYQSRILYQGSIIVSDIKGGNEDGFDIIGRKLKRGNFFNQQHVQKSARVIVLGSQAAKDLFKFADPIGKIVHINNIPFVVIGVIHSIERGQFDYKDPNLEAFVPYTSLRKFLQRSRDAQFGAFVVSGRSMEEMPTTVKHLKRNLRSRRHLELGEPDDFFVYDQGSMMKAAEAAKAVLNLLLIIIAAISLLVGGIGVMNIMLVTVSERTKEIGIRMALGAPDRLILRQFLIESLIICFLGGLIGILFGLAIPFGAKYFTGWEVLITPSSIFIAFVSIFIVGIAFGYYPARKASQLSPVQALLDQ